MSREKVLIIQDVGVDNIFTITFLSGLKKLKIKTHRKTIHLSKKMINDLIEVLKKQHTPQRYAHLKVDTFQEQHALNVKTLKTKNGEYNFYIDGYDNIVLNTAIRKSVRGIRK